MKLYAQQVFTPGGLRTAQEVTVVNGLIAEIAPGDGANCDARCALLAPGLTDMHCHGGFGYRVSMPDIRRLEAWLGQLADHGVCALLAGVSTCAPEVGEAALCTIREAMARQSRGEMSGARLLGVHLEGPFLSPLRHGAMDPALMPLPDVTLYEKRFGAYDDIVKLVTLAPEQPGAQALIRHLRAKGIRVQAGHTDCQYEDAMRAFGYGVGGVCHTFNAARGIHHREPGVLTAAFLSDEVYCEAICDLNHLHPAALRLMHRLKGPTRMIAISDAVATTGLPDGSYDLGAGPVQVKRGACINAAGALAGGGCFLDGAVRNLRDIGIPLEHALRMASRTPAEWLGRDELGEIAPGRRALLAGFDAELRVMFSVLDDEIWKGGESHAVCGGR